MWWTFGFLEGFLSVLGYLLSVYTHIYFFFYLYYFFGAGLTPAILGLGSVYLLPKSKFNFQLYITYMTIILAIILFILLLFSHIISSNFNVLTDLIFKNVITTKNYSISLLGVNIIKNSYWLIPLVILNSIGTIEIVGVSLYSFIQDIKKKRFSKRSTGLIFIVVSSFLLATVASISRFYNISVIWLGFLFTWILFFVGYILIN